MGDRKRVPNHSGLRGFVSRSATRPHGPYLAHPFTAPGRAAWNDPQDLDLFTVHQLADPWPDPTLPVIAVVDGGVQPLPLGLTLEAAHPDVHRVVALAAEAGGDDHALRHLERDDLGFHQFQPGGHHPGADRILAEFVEGHRVILCSGRVRHHRPADGAPPHDGSKAGPRWAGPQRAGPTNPAPPYPAAMPDEVRIGVEPTSAAPRPLLPHPRRGRRPRAPRRSRRPAGPSAATPRPPPAPTSPS